MPRRTSSHSPNAHQDDLPQVNPQGHPPDVPPLAAATPLDHLATRIKAEHEEVVGTLRKSLTHARKCGELLSEARKLCKAEGLVWEVWVPKHCELSRKHADNYIAIFERWSEIERAAGDRLSDFTIKAALDALKRPKEREGRREQREPLTLQQIADAMKRHKIKGTPGALLSLLKELRIEVQVEGMEAAPVAAGEGA